MPDHRLTPRFRAACASGLFGLLLTSAGCGDNVTESDGHASNGAAVYGQFTGKGPTPEEKFAALKRKAESGEAKSQFGLARLYYNGDGVAKNDASAADWFRKAAEQGHVLAQYKLGAMYDQGEGVPKDQAQALEWWNKAAAQGNDAARESLANLSSKPAQ